MVGRRHDDRALGVDLAPGPPQVEEEVGRAVAGGVEERRPRLVPRQETGGVVVEEARVGGVDDEREVGVEGQRRTRAGLLTLGDEDGVRVCVVEPCADLPPDLGRGLPPVDEALVLDEGEGHVDAEAGDAPAQPEVDDVAQRTTVPAGARGVDPVAPGLLGVGADPAEVQRRLLVVEVLQVPARSGPRRRHPGRGAGDVAVPPGLGLVLAPDVPVSLLARTVGGELGLEPRVLDRGVTDDEVEDDPDPPFPGPLDELDQVLVRAVARGDPQVVRDVVARVDERRLEARVEPDRVDPEGGDVVEPVDDATEVPDAVTVAVGERLGIDLVDDGIGQP